MADVDDDALWDRIRRHAGDDFETKTGLPFTYSVPGNHLRVTRDGWKINRSLSRTDFRSAATAMPVDGPADIRGRQGMSHTWAILMDERIRRGLW